MGGVSKKCGKARSSLWPPQIEAVKQTHRHLGFERVVAKLPNGRSKGNSSSWLEGRLKERLF